MLRAADGGCAVGRLTALALVRVCVRVLGTRALRKVVSAGHPWCEEAWPGCGPLPGPATLLVSEAHS
jgi:hypothetical protein